MLILPSSSFGGNPPDDPFGVVVNIDDIRRTIHILIAPDAVAEVRALGVEKAGTVSGYFDGRSRELMAKACAELSGAAEGVYLTINPVRPDLIARAVNRCRVWAKHTTSDADILARYWIPLDFDPVKPSGISSTNTEHTVAIERAVACRDWLNSLGVPAESLVLADSGNGAHLLVRVELANDEGTHSLVKAFIEATVAQWSDSHVDVDRSMHNASRILKVYGTLAAKGDAIPDRPHRLARLLDVPERVIPVDRAVLESVAALVPLAAPTLPRRPKLLAASFDLATWLAVHNLPVVNSKPWQGGTIHVLNPCPWNPAHTDNSAWLAQHASGAIAAGCHHNGCTGKGWHDLREIVEPGWRGRHGLGGLALPANCSPAIRERFEQALRRGK